MSEQTGSVGEMHGMPVFCEEIVPEDAIFMNPATWTKLDARLNPKPAEPAEKVPCHHKEVYTIKEGWHCGKCGANLTGKAAGEPTGEGEL